MKPNFTPVFGSSLTALLLFISTSQASLAQDSKPGIFNHSSDVGQVKLSGSSSYDNTTQTYTITGAGENMWFGKDEFHFVWKEVKGDFLIRARMKFKGEGAVAHRKMGLMIRDSLTTGSPQVSAVIHGDGLTSFQFRRQSGIDTEEKKFDLSAPDVVQLERRGDLFIMSAARSGQPFDTVQLEGITLGSSVYIGLFVCSHNPEVLETATFDNVRLVYPAGADLVPYHDYLGSHLEVMDIATGHRRVLYSVPYSIQAPNWTKDGKNLIYNSKGLLFTYNLLSSRIKKINTGKCLNNNNDHVLSFDGKMLGISNHSDENSTSMVYTVPVTGGNPFQVTPKGPSYLHGWSPDGQYLIYTGQRNGNFDIYRIPVMGGEEVRLTDAKGLDDGSEYSPDGNYIYFNSARTGTMQIWRMKADGSGQKQLTFDVYNDWFPHISPDGKTIIFISFGPDVDAQDHPFYKHVYIRMMPAGGGKPKVIAYLYGGQGTMNVPNWSPDGKHIAFVSNSGMPNL